MSVRRQCNRYKTEPYGKDEADVINRAKRFFKDGEFIVSLYGLTFCSSRPSPPPFTNPKNSRMFKKEGKRWKEVSKTAP